MRQRPDLSHAGPILNTMENVKNRFRRGTAFKVNDKGALYLDFEPTRIIALRPAPARAWVTGRGKDAKWFGTTEPTIDVSSLIRDLRAEEQANAQGVEVGGTLVEVWRRRNFRRFLEQVPREVQDLCADGWAGATWPYFRLLQSTPAARDIAASHDGGAVVFAAALADRLVPRGTLAFARRLLGRKRREILGALGFPPTDASVNALAKVPRHHFSYVTLALLRSALATPEGRKRCGHLPRLSGVVLAMLRGELLPHLTPELLTLLADDDRTGFFVLSLWQEMGDALDLARTLGRKIPRLRTPAELKALHDALVAERRRQLRLSALALPPFPPVLTEAELATVRPLKSGPELLAEGDAMHHCLGTLDRHLELATSGRLHALALEGEERLTLAVVLSQDGCWHVHDLRAFGNEPASTDAWSWAEDVARRLSAHSQRGEAALLEQHAP